MTGNPDVLYVREPVLKQYISEMVSGGVPGFTKIFIKWENDNAPVTGKGIWPQQMQIWLSFAYDFRKNQRIFHIA